MIKDVLRLFEVGVVIILACVAYAWWTGAGRNSGKTYVNSPSAGLVVRQIASNDAVVLQAGTNTPETDLPAAASIKEPAADAVVAKVNGEGIAYGRVRSGIGDDMFSLMMADARQQRLDLLIRQIVIRQYLKEQGIKVAREDIEREITTLRVTPPPAGGCPCCSYASLDVFLTANFMTLDDLRDAIQNDLGIHAHVTALWNADFPPGQKRDALMSAERTRIEQHYERMSHIFFNTSQQKDFVSDPDGVRNRAKKKALDAWQRLEKGEDFAQLARERSEDAISRPKGGNLGYVQRGMFGDDVEKAFEALKPGAYSQPVESPWGFHVIRRELLNEQDIVDILRSEYEGTKTREIYDSIQKAAKIERFPF